MISLTTVIVQSKYSIYGVSLTIAASCAVQESNCSLAIARMIKVHKHILCCLQRQLNIKEVGQECLTPKYQKNEY